MMMVSFGRSRSTEADVDGGFDERELVRFLKGSRGYVTVHRPVFDEFGGVVDARLLWWNDAYGRVRVVPPVAGESFIEVAQDRVASLAAMGEAWDAGHCVQPFRFLPGHVRAFNIPVLDKQTWMEWQRTGEFLVRTVFDLDEMDAIDSFYADHVSIVAHADRMRAVAVERERIARNLHDTVIQNLYATALTLSGAGAHVSGAAEDAFNFAIESIGNVIAQIRHEIMDCEMRQESSLRAQIESVILPILLPAGTRCTVTVDAEGLPERILAHVRSVCTEAVSNAVRHGGASHIAIDLAYGAGDVRLTVDDDGSGVDPASVLHNGLKNMRTRAESLGGNMEITNKPEGGALLSWHVPVLGGPR